MVEDWNQDFQILLIEHADESFWTGDNKLEYFTTKANFDGDNALVPFHVIKKRNMKITIDSIEKMIVHHVGNKSNGEGVGFSEKNVNLEGIEQDIKKLLRKSFEMDDLFRFYFESTIDLNPIYSFVKLYLTIMIVLLRRVNILRRFFMKVRIILKLNQEMSVYYT